MNNLFLITSFLMLCSCSINSYGGGTLLKSVETQTSISTIPSKFISDEKEMDLHVIPYISINPGQKIETEIKLDNASNITSGPTKKNADLIWKIPSTTYGFNGYLKYNALNFNFGLGITNTDGKLQATQLIGLGLNYFIESSGHFYGASLDVYGAFGKSKFKTIYLDNTTQAALEASETTDNISESAIGFSFNTYNKDAEFDYIFSYFIGNKEMARPNNTSYTNSEKFNTLYNLMRFGTVFKTNNANITALANLHFYYDIDVIVPSITLQYDLNFVK
jgi:hypothetical protein